ncbi:putative plant disease resistance response protein [Medicago truncatula]|uniref:Dirigent protein n=1 Tax=Medicago truncatula TaxID=3880 RepID=G7JNW9_MEDTR|nr:pterocarpan synthase 1 [Medicago truncatula]AES91976.1 disease resistance-responsive, dirigent domain protein [Medicago truncatula]RHN64370.1 putative plant disease resistance response protein [Medicago truncatula]
MVNPLNLTSSSFFFIFTLIILYVAYTFQKLEPNQTNMLFYIHDHFTGENTSAVTVAGINGPNFNIQHFGTVAIIDDPVTEGPAMDSTLLGSAQGVYVNSQLDSKAVYMVFSVIFTSGKYIGSTLEMQGYSLYTTKEREFGIVSGTGYFRFVKGYAVMETQSVDLATLRTTFKLNVTIKHY